MDLPPYAERIKIHRLKSGFTPEEMAVFLEINLPSYHDIESYDAEIIDSVSLTHLLKLCKKLSIRPAQLLDSGESEAYMGDHVTFSDLTQRIREVMRVDNVTSTELSERIGWDLEDVLKDPNAFMKWNLAGLQDLCSFLGIDWIKALPEG